MAGGGGGGGGRLVRRVSTGEEKQGEVNGALDQFNRQL